MYKHKKSGAEVMSAQADDDNKVFGIVFRTPPKDDTGVPHVLEHSVLCGSRKYVALPLLPLPNTGIICSTLTPPPPPLS